MTFEVASVKPSNPDVRGMVLQRTPVGGLTATNVTLKTLVEFAYDVRDFQISGGPRWLRADRFDISAKPERPEGPADPSQPTGEQERVMWQRFRTRLRALLAERFQLSVHRETEVRLVDRSRFQSRTPRHLPPCSALRSGGNKPRSLPHTFGLSPRCLA